MGNGSSSDVQNPRRTNSAGHPPPPHNVFGVSTPYPSQYPDPNANSHPSYHYQGNYPLPEVMPVPHGSWIRGRYPMPPPQAAVEHQKAVTIRNDINVKKETVRVEPDEEDSGKFVVVFSFDATVAGSISIIFFAKEGEDCNLTPTKESLPSPITVQFQEGLSQKFKQPSGTGIDLSNLLQVQMSKDNDSTIYPLAIKAEALADDKTGNTDSGPTNSQITLAMFDKDKEEYHVKVVKQILWVNGMRYELQEIYGIGNSVEDDEFDASETGKECVVCLSEPRDTTVLPCRHMCMCSECAKVLRFQTNRCPICRQPVERLLEIKVSNGSDE